MSSLFLIQLRRYTRFQVRCFLTVSRCDLDSELMQCTHTNKLNNFPYNLKIFRLIPHLSILYTQTEKLFWYFSQGNAILRGKKDAKLWINCNRKSARSSRGMETFLDVAGKYIDRGFFFNICCLLKLGNASTLWSNFSRRERFIDTSVIYHATWGWMLEALSALTILVNKHRNQYARYGS